VAGRQGELIRAGRQSLAVTSEVAARRLLGAHLTSVVNGAPVTVRVTEVEAYAGADDPASHAFRGRTNRTEIMFGPAGFLYVYFVYGMHWCANVVCGEDGVAAAVLLRAGEVVEGRTTAAQRRPTARSPVELARGPARLAGCLGLTRSQNGTDLFDPTAVVRIRLADPPVPDASIAHGPRVGVAVATEVPMRFWIAGEASVSAYRPGGRRRVDPTRQTEQP
jgi:DNA-3-methyladenine glycosylase